MFLLRRFSPLFITTVTFLTLWVPTRAPQASLLVLLIGWLALVLGYFILIPGPRKDMGYWSLIITPVLLQFSAGLFYLLLELSWHRVVMAIIMAFFQYLFAEHVAIFFYRPSRYRAYTIERLSVVFTIAGSFLLASAFFALLFLVQTPLWALAPAFFVLSTLALLTVLFLGKMHKKQVMLYGVAAGVLITELFVTLAFLPIGYTVSGAVVAIFLYFFLGVVRAYMLKRLKRPVFLRYAAITASALLLVLVTAQWV